MSLIFIKRNWNVRRFYLDQFVDQIFGVADQNDRHTKTIYSTFDGIEVLKNTSNTSGLTSELQNNLEFRTSKRSSYRRCS